MDRESVRQHEIRVYPTIVNVEMDRILFYLVHRKVCIDHFERLVDDDLHYLDPCSHNPCGHGICEVVPKLLYGYLCRCAGDTISLTSCNGNEVFLLLFLFSRICV